MIFHVTKASGLPIFLEPEQRNAIEEMDRLNQWEDLMHYEKTLREDRDLCFLDIEAEDLTELNFFFASLDSGLYPITLDFTNNTIVIQDNRQNVN